MKIYFTRHAESEANVSRTLYNRGTAYGLTEKGKQQADALASEMRQYAKPIHKIYSSRMLRAMQTAKIVAQATSASVEYFGDLRDFDCGIAEGRNDPAAWAMHNAVMREWLEKKNYDARIEQGESFNDMRNRFVPIVEQIMRNAQLDDNIIVVTHGAISVCILPLVLKNIDHAFALTHSGNQPTNARYVLAETTSQGLICTSWYGVPAEGVRQVAG
jgi:broad specificity phosphatase PhoE